MLTTSVPPYLPMASSGCTTTGSTGRRSSSAGRSPLATNAASSGASWNSVMPPASAGLLKTCMVTGRSPASAGLSIRTGPAIVSAVEGASAAAGWAGAASAGAACSAAAGCSWAAGAAGAPQALSSMTSTSKRLSRVTCLCRDDIPFLLWSFCLWTYNRDGHMCDIRCTLQSELESHQK